MYADIIKPDDREQWQTLWLEYLGENRAKLPEGQTDWVWAQITNPDGAIQAVAARDDDGNLAGCALYSFYHRTWHSNPVCYVDDIFVRADKQRQGVAKVILDQLQRMREEKGWHHVCWFVEPDNRKSMGMSDKYAQQTPWVRFEMK